MFRAHRRCEPGLIRERGNTQQPTGTVAAVHARRGYVAQAEGKNEQAGATTLPADGNGCNEGLPLQIRSAFPNGSRPVRRVIVSVVIAGRSFTRALSANVAIRNRQ